MDARMECTSSDNNMSTDGGIASRSTAVLSDWLPRAVHDLRGPLGPMRMVAQLLEGSNVPSNELPELGRAIDRQTSLLLQLADDLEDVLCLVHDCFRLQLAPCDLAALVSSAIEQASQHALNKGWAARPIRVQASEEAIVVDANARRFEQLLALLIAQVAPDAPCDARTECVHERDWGVVRIVDDAHRIYRSAAIEYVATGAIPLDPGTLSVASMIAREIALAHRAEVTISEDAEGRIGEIVLRLPTAIVT